MVIPTREIFWNVHWGEIIYVPLTILFFTLIYAVYQRFKMWQVGKPADESRLSVKRLWAFVITAVTDIFCHRKFFGIADGLGKRNLSIRDFYPREVYAGLMHFLIFSGFFVLLICSMLDAISHNIYHFMEGRIYLVTSMAADIFGVFLLIGTLMALFRRYIIKPDRLDNSPDNLCLLILILITTLSGFAVEGFRMAATELKSAPDWAYWSPGGFVIAQTLTDFSRSTLLRWHQIAWWLHVLLILLAGVYALFYFSHIWHIIVTPANIFLRRLGPPGALDPTGIETEKIFGAHNIQDFTWKQLMDLDACTRCGRCQENCPAYLSKKPLNPKKIIIDLKSNLEHNSPILLKGKSHPTKRDIGQKGIIGSLIEEDEIWNCTTCYACQAVCPAYIEPMAKIVEMRRNLVMEHGTIPETGEKALISIEDRGHPWQGTTATRIDWLNGLNVNILSEKNDMDMLYWVGCTSALEERNMKVARSLAHLLHTAGIKIGVLGIEESCCGDPARRLGNDYLFQIQAKKNIDVLTHYHVKQIVTSCPHCFNTLKNEYPQFGGNFEVVHHTELIARLLEQGKLNLSKSNHQKVIYHDACYLGRYNHVFQPPRTILQSIPDLTLLEFERNFERSFCCGAGGGHLWLEEQKKEKRINEMRTEQAIETNAQTIITPCPYCLQMLEDGVALKSAEGSLQVMDIAEIVEQSMV